MTRQAKAAGAAARAAALVLVAVSTAALALLPGCFDPDRPACAFSCVEPPYSCPSGFSCGNDGLCHDLSNPGLCQIEPVIDAGQDTESVDSGSVESGAGDAAGSD